METPLDELKAQLSEARRELEAAKAGMADLACTVNAVSERCDEAESERDALKVERDKHMADAYRLSCEKSVMITHDQARELLAAAERRAALVEGALSEPIRQLLMAMTGDAYCERNFTDKMNALWDAVAKCALPDSSRLSDGAGEKP